MTYGPGSPAACSSAWRSAAAASEVCGAGGASLVPSPKRSYEQTRVVFDTVGSIADQFSVLPPNPAMSTTVVGRVPAQRMGSRAPCTATCSSTIADGRAAVVVVVVSSEVGREALFVE